MGFIGGSAARVAFATAAALVVVAVLGASAAGSASGPVDAKHFFWAQRPGSGGNGERRCKQHHLPRRQRRPRRDRRPDDAGRVPRLLGHRVGHAASPPPTRTGSSTRARRCRTTSTRSWPISAAASGRPCRRSTAATCRPGRRAAPASRGPSTSRIPKHQLKGVWTDPTPVPDEIIAFGLAREPRRRPDRDGGAAGGRALHVRPERDVHHHDAAAPGRDRTARLLRLPHADDEPRTGSATRSGSSTRSSRGRTPTGPVSGRAAGCTTSTRRATPSATASSTAGASSSATSTPRPSPTRTTSSPSRTAGTTTQTSENADKCAWIETQNITLGGHQFAVQPTWSNEAFDAGKDPAPCRARRSIGEPRPDGRGSRSPRTACRRPHTLPARRGAGAVERGGLENRWACKRPVGSNPTPAVSARTAAGDGVGSGRASTAGRVDRVAVARGDEPELVRPGDRLQSTVDAELGEDPLQVARDQRSSLHELDGRALRPTVRGHAADDVRPRRIHRQAALVIRERRIGQRRPGDHRRRRVLGVGVHAPRLRRRE